MILAAAEKTVLPGAKRPHLRALTSLRIFATMHVVAAHFCFALAERDVVKVNAWAQRSHSPAGPLAEFFAELVFNFLKSAVVSVSMFFVLSGFILAYNYLDPTTRPIRQIAGRREFWLARLARVYPAYLLAWIIATPAAVHTMFHSPAGIPSIYRKIFLPLTSLTMTHAWVPGWGLQWNSPAWSLCTEAAFYVLFPLVLLRADGRPRNATGGTRRGQWIVAAMWIVLAALPPALFAIFDPDHMGRETLRNIGGLQIVHGPWLDTVGSLPLIRMPELFLGAAMGRIFLMDVRAGRTIPRWSAGAALALIAVAIIARPYAPYAVYVAGGGMASLFALLIYALAHETWPARLISGNMLVLLGEASYSIYILHAPLGGWYRMVVGKLMPGVFANQAGEFARTPSWGYAAVFIVLMLPIGVLSFKFFETPARYLIRSRFRMTPPNPPTVPDRLAVVQREPLAMIFANQPVVTRV